MNARSLKLVTLITCGLLGGGSIVPVNADWQSGLAAFKSGDLAAAQQEFQALTDDKPDWHGGHLMLGQTLLRQSRASEAIAALERAVSLAPDDVASSLALAQAAVLGKRFELATDTLMALGAESLDAKAQVTYYRLRGQAALGRHDYGAAYGDLQQAVRRVPQDAKLRYQLATVAFKEGEPARALEELEKASTLDPKNDNYKLALAKMRQARIASLEGDEKQSLCRTAAREGRAVLTAQATADNLLLIGSFELCAGDHEQAESLLAQSVDMSDSDRWQPSYYLARSRVLQHKWDAAESALSPQLGRVSEPGAANRIASLMGYIYEGQQRYELAITQYAQTGESEKVTRAREALEIQNRNAEIERIAKEIARVEAAGEQLDAEEEELGIKR